MTTQQSDGSQSQSKRRRGRRRRKSGSGQQSGGSKGGSTQQGGSQQGGSQQKSSKKGASQHKKRRGRGRGKGRSGGGQPQIPHDHEQDVDGLLEMNRNGNGLVRMGAKVDTYDPTITSGVIRGMGLREGDRIEGHARGGRLEQDNISQVNGSEPEDLSSRPRFDTLTAIHPEHAITLGATPKLVSGRLLDIVAPVGRGQRGLIVAPPKAGKTTLLRDMAIGAGFDDDLTIITCLVAERPEEVTDLRRAVPGLVLAADLDTPPEAHIRVAHLGVEYAKRLVEGGRHVVMLLDSLTRLARAHNLALKGSSRTLSGGMDAAALQPVRKVFGAARTAEEGGSLTMLATCLVDTGSKMDDVVYEEFKGTGNMEVVLDRTLAEKRLFPAVDITRSGTRRDDLLLDEEMLRYVTEVRRQLGGASSEEALTAMLSALRRGAAQDQA